MQEAADRYNYEAAARLRDRIVALRRVTEGQKVVWRSRLDMDLIAAARAQGQACVQVFLVRGGKLIGQEHFILDGVSDTSDAELFGEFLKQFYTARAAQTAPGASSRDGSVLRLVPACAFTLLGSTVAEIDTARAMDHDGELFALGHEMPQFCPFVRSFYIGVHTVTNRQFAQFLTMRRPSPAELHLWLPMADHIRAQRSRKSTYQSRRRI